MPAPVRRRPGEELLPVRRRVLRGPGGLSTADLAISVDVIYHLTADAVFESYMTHLFAAAAWFVVIYSTDKEISGTAPHVRHREFSWWADENAQAGCCWT